MNCMKSYTLNGNQRMPNDNSNNKTQNKCTKTAHKLSSLYEEAPEGIGFRNAKNLGRKIAAAIKNTVFVGKSRGRDTHNKHKKRLGVAYPPQPRIGTTQVMKKPRHRKFFGLDKPQEPY